MRHLIFTDCETGGLDPSRHALLTVGLVEWCDGVIGGSIEFKLHADPMQVDPRALAVNRIDLATHNSVAEPPYRVAAQVEQWCREHWREDGRVRLAGHNVAFDVGFLRALMGLGYERQFHYRPVCTMSLLPFLWHAGRLSADVGKLGAACTALGVEVDPETAHTALGDAVASARLYTRLLALVS